MQKEKSDMLRQLGIHATMARLQMLSVLESAQKPLLAKEIEELLGPDTDRVTVYRTLKLFVQKGLLHRIDVSDSVIAYRLSSGNGEHLHFHCITCHQVFCMPQLPIGPIELPNGFAQVRNRLVVDGMCKMCNKTIS